MDYDRFLSQEAKRFTHASLAGLIHRFAGIEGVVSLAGGLPPAEAFPLSGLQATTREGQQISLGAEGQQAYLAQQYNFNPQGHVPLLDWLRLLSARQHGIAVPGPHAGAPPSAGPPRDLVLSSGAIHAINALISCLTDPGDTIVVDEYTYTHALECVFLPRGLRLLPVRGDAEGMDPGHLEAQLRAARRAAEAAAGAGAGACRAPRLLYCIPTGHNPTGAVMGEERKRRILQVCEAYDMLVLEDDAYGWLHYPGGPLPAAQQPGLAGLPRSLVSMDAAGRVIRIDTFSKLLGPGYRLGWLTAPQPLVAKLANWVMASTVGPCGVSQLLVTQLLQQWGEEGFTAYLRNLQALYASRAAAAQRAAEQHLTGLAEWRPPVAGMFMWIKLLGVPDVASILDELVAARVVVVPGSMFATTGLQATLELPEEVDPSSIAAADADSAKRRGGRILCDGPAAHAPEPAAPTTATTAAAGKPSPYLRLSFAGCPPEVLAEGLRRLAEATRAVLARGQADAARR